MPLIALNPYTDFGALSHHELTQLVAALVIRLDVTVYQETDERSDERRDYFSVEGGTS